MRTLLTSLVLITAVLRVSSASAQSGPQAMKVPPSQALLSTAELSDLYMARKPLFLTNQRVSDATSELQSVIHAGQRAYDWINVVNKGRTKPLSYSDPSTTTNPTMEKPKIYNAEFAKQLYAAIQMPANYRANIEGSASLPTDPGVTDQDFISLGLKVTLAYDTAIRWIMMQPYLDYYETQKIMDLRGYYFLSQMPDRDSKLQNFSSLSGVEQKQIHDWMVDLCINDQGFASFSKQKCEDEIRQTENDHGLRAYYQSKLTRCKELWDSLFELYADSVRTDLTWTSKDPSTLHYPFLQPMNANILTYLRDNVEDEWKTNGWHLKMDFTTKDSSSYLSRLEYQKNVTPHEETNKIVMDANEPLTEYLTQWTIRHEFGHLLGFKDCYVEFYDADLKAMVNYPIDPSNLMCSRRGHLQPQHIAVLKAAYYNP